MKKRQILLVDDDARIVEVVGERLRFEGFHVVSVYTAEAGLRLLKKRMPDLIVLDIGMPGMNGMTFLNQLTPEDQSRPKVLVFTARADNLDDYARHPAVHSAMAKTSGPDSLIGEIHRLLGMGPASSAAPA